VTRGGERSAGGAAAALLALVCAAGAAGCANWPPGAVPLGTPIAQVRGAGLPPSGEYTLSDGGTRLEYDQGAQTYMLDFNAAGVLVASKQVLTQDEFAEIVPGMSGTTVRIRLGHPASTMSIPRQDLQVWNYRFWVSQCELFQVSVNQTSGKVTEAGIGPNLECGGPNVKK
jgi:hypothetical protein